MLLAMLACGVPEGPAGAAASEIIAPEALPDFHAVEPHDAGRQIGQLAPDGALPRVDAPGEFRLLDTLSSEGTRAVLVVFMAAWCGVCDESLPQLVGLEQRYAADGLRVVVYATDKNRLGHANLLEKVRGAGLEGPVAMGPGYVQNAWLGSSRAIPRFFFVDRSGRIVGKEHGYDEAIAGRMEARVQAALAGGTAG